MSSDRPSPRPWALAALALAVVLGPGCTNSQGLKLRKTTAASFLRDVEESKDPNVRYAAYDSLGSTRCYDDEGQKARAATVLVAKLKAGREPVATRAVICRTLGILRRPEARDVILSTINDEDPLVRAEACRALGRVGRPDDATVLARVMTLDVSGECRVAAIESIGELRSGDQRINHYLITGMDHDDPAIRVACLDALRSISGKDLGVEPEAWKKYVDSLDPPARPAATDPVAPDARPAAAPMPRP